MWTDTLKLTSRHRQAGAGCVVVDVDTSPAASTALSIQLSKLSVVLCRAKLSLDIQHYAHGQDIITYTIMASAGYCSHSPNKDYRVVGVLNAWYI